MLEISTAIFPAWFVALDMKKQPQTCSNVIHDNIIVVRSLHLWVFDLFKDNLTHLGPKCLIFAKNKKTALNDPKNLKFFRGHPFILRGMKRSADYLELQGIFGDLVNISYLNARSVTPTVS